MDKKKVTFKSKKTSGTLQGVLNIENISDRTACMPINGFTAVDFGYEKGNALSNMVNMFIE